MTTPDITGDSPADAAAKLVAWAQEDPPGRAQAALDVLDKFDVGFTDDGAQDVADAGQTLELWATAPSS